VAIEVIGSGVTKFGEHWDKSLSGLAFAACEESLAEAGLMASEIDVIFVANMAAGVYSSQLHLGPLVAEILGVDVPAYHIESACASGGFAINAAYNFLRSGNFKRALVVGVEKMSDVGIEHATTGLAMAADEELEATYGVTFPSLYAMMAREYLGKYELEHKLLSQVAVKNHYNGRFNGKAQFAREITLEQAEKATVVATPLRLFDCSPLSDGAAAVVLSADEDLNKRSKYRIELMASAVASSSLSLQNRASITSLDAAKKAAEKAFKEANLRAADIGIAEVHDCFTIAELIAYEDLGFAEVGKAHSLVEEGLTRRDGKLPINTSGGLKACGHPVGATGVKQVVEVARQLAGRAGNHQIDADKSYGLTHNVGGSGASAAVTILKNNN
jgi:acetyl-CoA C-acetyltransferase